MYVSRVADAVNNYQEKVGELIEILDKINVEINALDKCQYKGVVISQILSSIQKSVDQLFLNDYSNLKNWMQELDSTVSYYYANRGI